MKIGLLHPGDMGASVGYSLTLSGNGVYWASEGRSLSTYDRANRAGLTDRKNLNELLHDVEMLVSVCPPLASEAMAGEILNSGFEGIYLDANAISPKKSQRISDLYAGTPIDYVDGGIVGTPAWHSGTTRLYLSGEHAEKVASVFSGGTLDPRVISNRIGSASAMKMCFAAYTKGSTSLIAEILATAKHFGVTGSLINEWGEETTDARIANIQRIASRAWRWEAEMHEIGDTLEEAGIPDGAYRSAAELYARMEEFRDVKEQPDWDRLLKALLEKA